MPYIHYMNVKSMRTSLSGSQIPSPRPPPSTLSRHSSSSHDSSFCFHSCSSPPPLSPSYASPDNVLHRFPRCFLLRLGDCTETVSVSRLKPAHLPPNPLPAQPPTQGTRRDRMPESERDETGRDIPLGALLGPMGIITQVQVSTRSPTPSQTCSFYPQETFQTSFLILP